MSRYDDFLALHHRAEPLLIPNPWDGGSARVLAGLGFPALATTSAGYAGTLGRLDGGVTADEALAHGAVIAAAVDVPVSADLENGFADEPEGVVKTVLAAVAAGLAGCSIEDYTRSDDAPIYDHALAVERIAAAAEAAHAGPDKLVLTARSENYLRGRADLDDTIRRLQDYGAAGADVVYAPGLTDLNEITTLVGAVEQPVNVLVLPGGPSVAELAEAGVSRISLGGFLATVALGALVQAAREFQDGSLAFLDRLPSGANAPSQWFR